MNTVAEPTSVPVQPAFCIDSESSADWLLKQLAALDAERALLARQHQAAMQRVESDRESLLYLYGPQLEAWAAQQVQADKRGRKSCILPHGTLAFRTVPASLHVSDPDAALEAAKQFAMPDMVKVETREVLDAARYQKAAQVALLQHGCLLPGVEVTHTREAFSIKFGKGAREE